MRSKHIFDIHYYIVFVAYLLLMQAVNIYPNNGQLQYAYPAPNVNMNNPSPHHIMMYRNLPHNKRARGILSSKTHKWLYNKNAPQVIDWAAEEGASTKVSVGNRALRATPTDNFDVSITNLKRGQEDAMVATIHDIPNITPSTRVEGITHGTDYTDPLIKGAANRYIIVNNGAVASSTLSARPDVAMNAVDRNMPM